MRPLFNILFITISLVMTVSCLDDGIPTSINENHAPLLKKVVFSGYESTVLDTLSLHYTDGKINSIDWCTNQVGTTDGDGHPICVATFLEFRDYNNEGMLDSIHGRFNIGYAYENGMRKEIMAFKNGAFESNTTFLNYSGGVPTLARIEFSNDLVRIVEMTFSADGDLVRKTIKTESGNVLIDAQLEYSSIENPIKGLLETASTTAEVFGFDPYVFYFSTHVPVSMAIDNHAPNTIPGKSVVNYVNSLNSSGQLVSSMGFSREFNMHGVTVFYAD